MKTVFLNIGRINYDGKINLIENDNFTYYQDTNYTEILERIVGFDIVVTKELKMDEFIINGLPSSVKMICEAGTGYNNIDVDACKKRGIVVCNVPDYATNNVALFTIMLMLNMSISTPKQVKMLSNGDFGNFGNNLLVNYSELTGKTLGIIGLGKIGQKVATFARALGMNVICYTRSKKDGFKFVKYVDLEGLLSNSDYISLNCLLSDDTYHIINNNNIHLIKNGAYIINTARGQLIEEDALITALISGKVAGAGLDVLEKEPGSKSNPLFNFDNVMITPHMAWNSIEARSRLLDITYKNIESFSKNKPINVVNK